MKIQVASRLAIYAVLELASTPDQHCSASEIGEKFGASPHHLSKVLHTLGRHGLVRSVRGVGGGYSFSGNAKRTTLMDIVELFENLGSDTDRGEPGMETPVGRALGLVFTEIDEITEATLRSITISTMLKIIGRHDGGRTNDQASAEKSAKQG